MKLVDLIIQIRNSKNSIERGNFTCLLVEQQIQEKGVDEEV